MIKEYCIIYESIDLVFGDFSYESSEKTITVPAKDITMAVLYATEKLEISFIKEVFELD